MLYLVWYLVAGIIATLIVSVAGVIIVPSIIGYDLDLWIDLLQQCLEDEVADQTWFENILGIVIFITAWPIKIVYMIGCFLPEVAASYEFWYENED